MAAWCVNLYAEGAEGQNPEGYAGSVYEWEPHTVIKTALVGSMFPLTSTLVCALIRGHVPPFGRQGKIINGQRQGGLCACCNWYAEDNTVRQQKEDIGQMSGVLGLLFGPFLVITVIGSCLYLVVWGLLQSPDGSGYISRGALAKQAEPSKCLTESLVAACRLRRIPVPQRFQVRGGRETTGQRCNQAHGVGVHVAAGLLRDYLGRVRQHSSSGLRVYVHRAP